MSDLYNEIIEFEGIEPAVPGQLPPIPEGKYLVRVTDASPEPAKSGAPMYTLRLEIAQGEYKGRVLWHRRTVQVKTAAFVKGDMQALRIQAPPRAKAGEVAKYVVREALGKLVLAQVGLGSGEYANRNEVKALLPPETEDEVSDVIDLDPEDI